REAEQKRRGPERQRPPGTLPLEGAIHGGEEKRERHGDGRLHPEAPDRLSRRERPGGGARRRGEVREAPAPQEIQSRQVGEVELREKDPGLDPRLRKEEGDRKSVV